MSTVNSFSSPMNDVLRKNARWTFLCIALVGLAVSANAQTPAGTSMETQESQMEPGSGCDPMCRGMMQMEMDRARWMVPFGIVIGSLATAALALLVVLEVLWIPYWIRRLKERPSGTA